jgi:hypothetical protein
MERRRFPSLKLWYRSDWVLIVVFLLASLGVAGFYRKSVEVPNKQPQPWRLVEMRRYLLEKHPQWTELRTIGESKGEQECFLVSKPCPGVGGWIRPPLMWWPPSFMNKHPFDEKDWQGIVYARNRHWPEEQKQG